MDDTQAAAVASVLGDVVPIGDDPRVADLEQQFGQAVAADIAQRPSPVPKAVPPDVAGLLVNISGQLLTVIHQNAAILEILGKGDPQ